MEENWIVSDPNVCFGKPRVRGTRLAVRFLRDLLANGWTEEQVLEGYPRLTPEALRAAVEYPLVQGLEPPHWTDEI